MAANSEDFDLVVIKGIALLVLQFIAHNINDILHIITAVLTIGYLLWRWRRDWRKEKRELYGKENNKTENS